MNCFIERFADAYRAEMVAFVEMLKTGAEPLAGMADGLEAQRLAEAAIVSMQTGKVVELTAGWQTRLTGNERKPPVRTNASATACFSKETQSALSSPPSRKPDIRPAE